MANSYMQITNKETFYINSPEVESISFGTCYTWDMWPTDVYVGKKIPQTQV